MHFRSTVDTSMSRTRRIQFIIFSFNLTQYELFQEESDLLKAGLYFSIQPDKIRKSEIFTTFEKIHRSFPRMLRLRHVLQSLR